MITHKDHTVHTPRNIKSCFSFFAFLPYPRGLWRKQCVSSEVCFNFCSCVLLIPKDLADNHQPCKVAQLQFTYPTFLCPIIRWETQSFDGAWRLNCCAWWLGGEHKASLWTGECSWGGGEGSIQYETTEMLVRNSRSATEKAIRVWFYFVTIFVLHTNLRDKRTGKSSLARAPYLRPKFVTYCKTTGTSFSLIWEPPPSPRQVGKNSSIRLQSIILLHKKFLQFDWLRAVVF